VLAVGVTIRGRAQASETSDRPLTKPIIYRDALFQLVLKIEQTRGWVYWHSRGMKKSELTLKQVPSVACPTCGVTAGRCCELNTGAPRSHPHVDRKLAAMEAIEGKQTHLVVDGRLVRTISRGSQICHY